MTEPAESMTKHVERTLRADIEAGRLRDGQALPSTRVLAEQFGVSVFTVTEAIKALAEDGLVLNRPRSGRVVQAPPGAKVPNQETPHVVLIGGYPGSGKSEMSRIVSRLTGWVVFDKDTITRALTEALLESLGCPTYDRESDTYLSNVRPHEYQVLAEAIRENAECGVSVIASAPYLREFPSEEWMTQTRAEFEEIGSRVSVLWMDTSVDLMHTYVERRAAARDTVKLANWPAHAAAIDVNMRPVGDHRVIKNAPDAETLHAQARTFLASIGVLAL